LAFNQRAVDYVKSGLDKGFSETHISKIMKKHGYNSMDIAEAISQARIKRGEQIKRRQPPKPIGLIAIVVVLAATLTILLITGGKGELPTGAVIITDVDEYEAYLSRITQLQQQVDAKEAIIEEALEKASQAQIDKEQQYELVADLEEYYKAVKEERKETNKALIELMDFLFERKIVE
jgi:hypothetical protein